MRRIGKIGSQVGNFLKGNSRSSGSSRGRTQEWDEGSSRRPARSPSPEFSNLRSRSSSAASSVASSPAVSRSSSATNSPVRSRPISTVASPTRFDANGRVTDPGHIQYQTSDWEREQYGAERGPRPLAVYRSRFSPAGALPGQRVSSGRPAFQRARDQRAGHQRRRRPCDRSSIREPCDRPWRNVLRSGCPVHGAAEPAGLSHLRDERLRPKQLRARSLLPGRAPFQVGHPTPPTCNAGPTGRADARLEGRRLPLQKRQQQR